MFNLGLPEIIIIGVIALLVFGPKRLPDLAKNLGKGIRDFKKALEGREPEEEEKKLSTGSTESGHKNTHDTDAPEPKT